MKCIAIQAIVLGLAITVVSPILGQTKGKPSAGEIGSDSGLQSDAASVNRPHDENFVIGDDDVLLISVWKEPDLTKTIPVRSDGKISLPLIGEILAAGKTPLQLERDITEKLKSFMNAPEVSVIVQQVNSRKFNILGEVGKPGTYPLKASTSIMDAIATAGGFRDFAKKSGVYVLRKSADGRESRLKFNYKDFIKGKDPAQNIKLEPNDTVIVP